MSRWFFSLIILILSSGVARAETSLVYRDLLREGRQAPQARTSAATCGSIDLRDGRMGPVRDQGTMPWCADFGAADVASFWTGEPVSALDIGLSHFKQKSAGKRDAMVSSDRQGGNPAEALKSLLDSEKGFCSEKDLPAEFGAEGPENEDLKKKIESVERLKDAMDRDGSLITHPCENCVRSVQKMFPGLDFNAVMDVLQHSSRNDVLFRLQQRSCDGKRIRSGIQSIETYQVPQGSGAGAVLLPEADRQLESGAPVLVGFNDFVSPEGSRGARGGHASTLVGRRWNTNSGKCEYLVRGTWGGDCSNYASRFECDSGNLWVSETELGGNLMEVVSMSGSRKSSPLAGSPVGQAKPSRKKNRIQSRAENYSGMDQSPERTDELVIGETPPARAMPREETVPARERGIGCLTILARAGRNVGSAALGYADKCAKLKKVCQLDELERVLRQGQEPDFEQISTKECAGRNRE